MAKERTWLDYTNLASNVTQNVQLGEIQSALKSLGALQAEKVRLELSEQQTREREDSMRENLWQLEHSFDGISSNAAISPCVRYIMAKQVQDSMAQFGVTTASFSQLCDKDRIGEFQNRLRQTIEDARGKLSQEQKADVEKYLQYSAELEELTFLLRTHESAAKWCEAKPQWEDAAKKLRQMLEPFIDRKSAEQMRALEQTMVAADQEAEKIDDGPDGDSDEAGEKWSDALDRRDDAAAKLRQMIEKSCELMRQNSPARPAKPGPFWNRLAAQFQVPAPAKPMNPEMIKEMIALEKIMQTSAEAASSPPDTGGARAVELIKKHRGKAEDLKMKAEEHEAFVRHFKQTNGL